MKTTQGHIMAEFYIAARPATMREIDEGDTTLPWTYLKGGMVFEFQNHEQAYIDTDNWVWVGQCRAQCTIPGGVDLTEIMLTQLEEEKQKEIAKHYQKVQKIDEKIQSLRSLEHKPSIVAVD